VSGGDHGITNWRVGESEQRDLQKEGDCRSARGKKVRGIKFKIGSWGRKGTFLT